MDSTPTAPVAHLSSEQRAELKRLAEVATPGPWINIQDDDDEEPYGIVQPPSGGSAVRPLYIASLEHEVNAGNNAAYIAAANPATVAALLAQLAAAGAEYERRERDMLYYLQRSNEAVEERELLKVELARAQREIAEYEELTDKVGQSLARAREEEARVIMNNSGLGELLGDVLYDLKEAWAQGEWLNIKHLIEYLESKAGPAAPVQSREKEGEPKRECEECGEDYDPHCLTCREQVGEPIVLLQKPAGAPLERREEGRSHE